MKREPWKPRPPKGSLKCKTCRGAGKIQREKLCIWDVETHFVTCWRCGGKGVL